MIDPLAAGRDVALDIAAARLARRRDRLGSRLLAASALFPAPFGRFLERACPDALAQRLRCELGVGVVLGVAPVRDGVAPPDHPGVQILGFGAADSDDPAVAVGVARIAGHKALANVVCQSERRRLAAAVVLALSILADLRALGSVDAMQADPRSADLKRVAVDRRCPADDRVSQCGRGEEKDEEAGPGTHRGFYHSSGQETGVPA